jgi:hypothetical protein
MHDKGHIYLLRDLMRSAVDQMNEKLRQTSSAMNQTLDDVQEGVDLTPFRQRFAGDNKDLGDSFDGAASHLVKLVFGGQLALRTSLPLAGAPFQRISLPYNSHGIAGGSQRSIRRNIDWKSLKPSGGSLLVCLTKRPISGGSGVEERRKGRSCILGGKADITFKHLLDEPRLLAGSFQRVHVAVHTPK